jgi:hypothetical protein
LEAVEKDIVKLQEQPAAEPVKSQPKQGNAQPQTLRGRILNNLNS